MQSTREGLEKSYEAGRTEMAGLQGKTTLVTGASRGHGIGRVLLELHDHMAWITV
jgi:hypothetical protein